MKKKYFFSRAVVVITMSVLLAQLNGCAKMDDRRKNSIGSSEKNISETLCDNSYEMLLYTEAPNEKSSIQIQYPFFTAEDKEWLNTFIYDEIQSFTQIDSTLFPEDSAVTIDYQSTVTFQNHKIISFIIWGSYNIQGAAHPTTNLYAYNMDLDGKRKVVLNEIYNINEEFEKVFFEKAYFPMNPITSYDESVFSEMLKLQSPEYQTVSPFSNPGNITYFLKKDGIVLSLPATHATGSDHFEAQLTYSDIQSFYLLSQNYWED